jgi:glycosyltransferase involved in cell wall biosynthesis
MRIIGITVVRDAASTIRVCLLNQLGHGIERILVLDNGSTDATPTILRRLQRRIPISVVTDDGPFRQDEFMTGLLHEATDLGADWVVPFDDDEFLASDVEFSGRLGMVQRDGILIRLVNFVQRRGSRRESPRSLLSMVTRPEVTVEASQAIELGRSGKIAVVEVEKKRKLILRASRDLTMDVGNHGAQGIGPLELADWCRFLHAPIRSPGDLKRSAEQGRRISGLRSPHQGWEHFLMAEAEAEGRLDEQWRLNSMDAEMVVGPRRTPLVTDTALAEAVRPWVRSPVAQLAARLARKSF